MTAQPPPLLPPYGRLDRHAVECVAAAARYYEVPELLLHAILQKEGGRVGSMNRNKNGSWDLGPAQINTSWLPLFARYGVGAQALRDDSCTNIFAEGWVLRYNANILANDWFKATVAYNVGPSTTTLLRSQIGYRYAVDVVHKWWDLYRYVASTQAGPIVSKPSPEEAASIP
jgi:soluble lytic murein transglycosylase-like protein